uniref:Uncharacterized protein n=1 Tax=Moniliophthora roreri TaxID=221103 RepID=A0A0W0FAM0_MONRR
MPAERKNHYSGQIDRSTVLHIPELKQSSGGD